MLLLIPRHPPTPPKNNTRIAYFTFIKSLEPFQHWKSTTGKGNVTFSNVDYILDWRKPFVPHFPIVWAGLLICGDRLVWWFQFCLSTVNVNWFIYLNTSIWQFQIGRYWFLIFNQAEYLLISCCIVNVYILVLEKKHLLSY